MKRGALLVCALLAGAPGAAAQDFAIPAPKPRSVDPAPEPLAIPRPPVKPRLARASTTPAPAADQAEPPPPRRPAPVRPAPSAPKEAAAKPGGACVAALRAAGGRFVAAEPIAEGACGAPAPVRLSAVGDVTLTAAATLRCPAALAFAQWVTDTLKPAALRQLGKHAARVRVAASYHCRQRRGGDTTRLSEHGRANAIDVSALIMKDGTTVAVMERGGASADKRFQRDIREGACAHFTTVIGPGTNAAHADHLHFDLAERRGGYRLCE